MDEKHQNKALNIGVFTAFIIRGIIIFSGGILLQNYSFISYFFAAFLIYSAVKIFFINEDDSNKEPTKIINFIRRFLPGFSVLGIAIGVIELTDIMFAMDSIPASLGITHSTLIIYSANIFAILGLRSLYFVMLDMIHRFKYLEKIVGIILLGTGIKFLIGG